MPKQTSLAPMAPWIEIKTTPADWKKADPALLGAMLSQLHISRAFEEKVLELAGEGLVHGPAHSSIGQEGGAVGSIIGLRPTDQVNGSHRGHHQFLAKALTPRSLPEIGRRFGGRDHTTVLHAVRKIEKAIVEDRSLNDEIDLLRRMLLD